MKSVNIPAIAVKRLSLYARNLALLDQKGVEVVSSAGLADICGVNPAQIRKDLGYFGQFGIRGVGYYVKELLFEIRKILGLEKEWRLALVGVGNLGSALLGHAQLLNQGYTFVAAFETDPKRIGMQIGDITVAPVKAMKRLVMEKGVEIGVIAVSPRWAQQAADKFVKAGVRGILNFAPVQLQCPSALHVENVDFTRKLDMLCYRLTLND
ncbi:MAG: redox-sensing transcriptional repressor Rex [Deltaproteobacteria bacterium]|jgi:redox-sensing transcriptional repressor